MSDNEAYIVKTTLLKNNSLLSVIAKTNISHNLLKTQFVFFSKGFDIVELEDVDLNEGETTIRQFLYWILSIFYKNK